MAKQTIDFNKLRDEIDNRKQQKGGGATNSTGKGAVAPRDEFLYGLLESLNTGRETASSSLLKSVDNKVADKKGETNRLPISDNVQQKMTAPYNINEVDVSPERDEQLFTDIEKRRKQTLAESIDGYAKTPQVGAPMRQPQPQPQTGAPMQLNEEYLAENVKNIVNGYLTESLGPIFDEAIKGTIVEMFAVERIKDVLHENKDLIRKVVIDTIKEIQAKSKAKAQS